MFKQWIRNAADDLGVFARELWKHWLGFLGSGVLVIALGWVTNLGVTIPRWAWAASGAVGLIWACFLAWRSEHRRVLELEATLNQKPEFTGSIGGLVTTGWDPPKDSTRVQVTIAVKNTGDLSILHDWTLKVTDLKGESRYVGDHFTGQRPIPGSYNHPNLHEALNRDGLAKNGELTGFAYFLLKSVPHEKIHRERNDLALEISFRDTNNKIWTIKRSIAELTSQGHWSNAPKLIIAGPS